MFDFFTAIKDYLIHQADLHNVNPLLFSCLYLLSKILFVFFLGLAIRNLQIKKAIFIPLLFAVLGYSLPYLYLVIFGKDIPVWIYVVISLIYLFSAWGIRKKLLRSR